MISERCIFRVYKIYREITFQFTIFQLGANVTTVNLSALANELDTYASGIPDPYKVISIS